MNASTTHAESIISTTTRNAKFFPTINGKKVDSPTTINGINGTATNPAITTAFAKILCKFIPLETGNKIPVSNYIKLLIVMVPLYPIRTKNITLGSLTGFIPLEVGNY